VISNSNALDAVIIFQIAGKKCACEVDFIREVAKASSIYKIPNNHPLVEGILNLRGMIIPVIRFSSLLNQNANEQRSSLILVVNVNSFCVGLLVEHIFKVEKIINKKDITQEPNSKDKSDDKNEIEDTSSPQEEIDISWIPRRFFKKVVMLESGSKCALLDSKSLSQALWAYVPDRERGK